MKNNKTIIFLGNTWLTITDIMRIAQDNYLVSLNDDAELLSKLIKAYNF